MLKKTIYHLVSIILSLGFSLGFFLFGYSINKSSLVEFSKNSTAITVIIICLSALLVVLAVVNIVKLTKRKTFNSMTATESQDYWLEQKANVEKNYQEAEKSVNSAINRYNAYKIVIIFICYLTSFFIGFGGFFAPTVLIVLFFFITWAIFYSFFNHSSEQFKGKDLIIKEEEFPYIYSVIKRASQSVNYNGKITAVFSGGGISIGNGNGGIIITLPSEIVSLFSEEEFYAVLLHEFAHLKNQDTHLRKKLYSFIDNNDLTGENLLTLPNLIFLSGNFQEVALKVFSYDVYSSREKENVADQALVESGLEQAFINATAKSVLFSIYSEYPWKEITFDTYENETPVEDFCKRNVDCFMQKVALYGDKWHFTLKNELPARVDSHPTLLLRMEALNVKEYFVNFEKGESEFNLEQQKLLTKQSLIAIGLNFNKDKENARYKQERQVSYLERIEIMQKYDNLTEWDNLSDSELIECAQAFLFIDDKKSEKILCEVIERSNSSFACYLLGCLYAREYNDECIELFKRASVDPSATDECFDQIGKYALKTGNQPLLDEYRETVAKKVQTAEEEIQETAFVANALHAPLEKNNQEISEMKEKFCEYWGEGLCGLYIATRETDNQTTVYYIAIDVDKKFPPDKGQHAYEESCYFINRMSSVGKKFYMYFVGNEFNTIKKVNGSCIYKKEK